MKTLRNKAKFSFAALLCLYSGASVAETDTFNMLLTGEFEKDYCQLTLRSSKDWDIDLSTLNSSQREHGLQQNLNFTRYYIKCSAGNYDIHLSNTDLRDVNIPDKNQTLAQQGSFSNVLTSSGGTGIQYISNSNPSSEYDVQFTGDNSIVANFRTWLRPTDGEWNNVHEVVNYTYSMIITIEKR